MSDINEHFNYFASQMMKTTYGEFISTDLEYQEIDCYLSKHSKRFDEIISSLNEEDREFAEDYISKQSYESSCVNENLYIAGYRDCVKLLRKLGVLFFHMPKDKGAYKERPWILINISKVFRNFSGSFFN